MKLNKFDKLLLEALREKTKFNYFHTPFDLVFIALIMLYSPILIHKIKKFDKIKTKK